MAVRHLRPATEPPAEYKVGTAYGESLSAWRAAWDEWQAGTQRGADLQAKLEAEAWANFPDDPFYYDEI